ncbi:MAG: T9SS type A sorting domain-containing protein [Bacteroidota bacterium]
MKKLSSTLLLCLWLQMSYSQITITAQDMPNANETYRLSSKNVNNFDATQTGANYTWDYSSLIESSQTVDTFYSVQNTPAAYQVAFNNPFDTPHQANIALKQPNRSIANQVSFTEVFNYYKETSSNYGQVGFASKINTVPTPTKYDNIEVIYKFPTNYGDKDSSNSSYSLSIPSFGYYGEDRKRVNEVDGWGLLTTPYGTFNTLRIKSTIYISDSIFYSQYQIGNRINSTQTEYKWVANGFGVPILQINTNQFSKTAIYIDSLRNTYTTEYKPKDILSKTYPNPASNIIYLEFNQNVDGEIEICNLLGEIIASEYIINLNNIKINCESFENGMYIILLNKKAISKIAINKN